MFVFNFYYFFQTPPGTARVLVIPLSSISLPNSLQNSRQSSAPKSRPTRRNNRLSQNQAHNALVSLLRRRGQQQIRPTVIPIPRPQPQVLGLQLQNSLSSRLPAGITAQDITRQLLLNQIIEDIRKNRPQPTKQPGVLLSSPPINLAPKTPAKPSPTPPATPKPPIIIETGANSRVHEIRTVNGQTQVILDAKTKKKPLNDKNNPFSNFFNPVTSKPGEDPPEPPEMFNLVQAMGRHMGFIP